jgi:hypothetical protein
VILAVLELCVLDAGVSADAIYCHVPHENNYKDYWVFNSK